MTERQALKRTRPERARPERPKQVKCPLCGETMTHHKEFDFYKCPVCGAEAWPEQDDDGDEEERQSINPSLHQSTNPPIQERP